METNVLEIGLEKLRKECDRYLKAEDFMYRIDVLNQDYNNKLLDRPNKKELGAIITNIEEKMKQINLNLTSRIDGLNKQQNLFDNELKVYEETCKRLTRDVNKKLDSSDGKRIWRHFYRFAEYNDLKDLYNKCIPQLAKFEQQVFDYSN